MAKRILKKFFSDIERTVKPGKSCAHEGEKGQYCGKCGADLRIISGYECTICSFVGRSTIYPTESVPSFCRKCGAPKFTFSKSRKRKSTKNKKENS